MLNELKKESLKKVLAWVVLWAVVAVGCFVYALPGVFAMLGGAEELSSLSAGELEGSYVKTDIRDLITGYAQTTRTGDGTEEVIEEGDSRLGHAVYRRGLPKRDAGASGAAGR